MNAIMVYLETESILCSELLAIHHINRENKYYSMGFYTQPGNYSSYNIIHLIAVNCCVATYDELVAIMKPHGLKVINREKLNMVCQSDIHIHTTITKQQYNELYDEGESEEDYVLIPPKNLKKHYRDLIKGLPYLYCYNIRDLAIKFNIIKQHTFRHKAIMNRVKSHIEEKIENI
jgi:hypothetical protein